MIYFLDRIASHLIEQYGDRLDRHLLVFPNRRAGLYFTKYLSNRTNKPVWSPGIKTINELFQSFSEKKLADSELLVIELFKVYREIYKNAGSIDDFFFWGEMLVNDFDDIDKYLIEAPKLFINLKEIKEIDQKFGGLTEEQIAIIRQFWINFNPSSPTDQKADFIEIWSILRALYEQFRDSLIKKGIAYEGMIYRELAEKCIAGTLKQDKWDQVHFIGFNALNSCEKVLMSYLQKSGEARFYWDYDDSFVTENTGHSAGYFIRENLKQFGNNMPADWSYKNGDGQRGILPMIRVIDSSSDVAQVKIAAKIIAESPSVNTSDAHHTALVLSDENLLLPALTSLPDNVESINVTMGYPLKYSPVYNLIKDILTLQRTLRSENGEFVFDRREVHKILSNSFFAEKSDTNSSSLLTELNASKDPWISAGFFTGRSPFDLIFTKIDTAKGLSLNYKRILEKLFILTDASGEENPVAVGINLRNEFIFRVILVINKLDAILSEAESIISVATYNRLFDRILRGLSVPFYGEPLNGIQIMGILETRSLDFRNLVILSVNEGIFPKNLPAGSFIPYNFREAFGLPTIQHQDSIYAYYFYRLLQRAEKITLIYNSASDGLKTGEMSRFILQLKYSPAPPQFSSQRFEIKTSNHVPSEIKRGIIHVEKLNEEYFSEKRKILTPSAVNSWLTCRMKFYYKYVCRLKEPEKVVSVIDPALFGQLLHTVMEKIYSPYKNKTLTTDLFDSISGNEAFINRLIADSVNERFYNMKKSILSGNDLITCRVLYSYIQFILKRDRASIPFEIAELEYNISSEIELKVGSFEKSKRLTVGGIIDRIDRAEGFHRITDYKTGKTEMEIPTLESLFDENEKNRNDSWFQILMYCHALSGDNKEIRIRPAVYPVRRMYDVDFTDLLTIKDYNGESFLIDDFETVKDPFEVHLIKAIETIFNPEESFRMTEDLKKCDFCEYARLCQR